MYKVSVIVPTTRDRELFNERIIATFQRQDWECEKELLFDLEGGKIGEKRNRLCERASGDIIVHFDSDDQYADDWITRSVTALTEGVYDLVGLSSAYFASANSKWLYTVPKGQQYILGATFCYWRSTWNKIGGFAPKQIGEDADFCARAGLVNAHDYIEGFTATIHDNNTASNKNIDSKEFVRVK